MQEKRLFVAVPLPAEIKNALTALPGAMQSDALRWVPAENWHLTVLFLGNVAADLVPSLTGKIREAALPPPFGMQLQNKIRAVHRRGRTEMLWATFENSFPYAQLCYRVAQVLDHVPDREPLPHVTLARTRKDFRGRIDDSQFPEVSPVEWEVSGFELWESQLLSHGAHYQVLERFELKRL